MKQIQINNLFPIPVYMSNMDRSFTKEELKFVDEQKNHCVKNQGNINTKDNYILNRKEFKDIKKLLEQSCKNYLETIIAPKNNIQLGITQSWLNYTEQNQFHHQHAHLNSIVSGTLYFNCNNDYIVFTNPQSYQGVKPKIKEYNIWNSNTWSIPVQTGQLIMFPSSTIHEVETKKNNHTRISLSFNTFYKGTIGSKSNLTELIL